MTLGLYCSLDGTDSRFDGHRAQTHLTRALAMRCVAETAAGAPSWRWLERHGDVLQVHPRGPVILRPPTWFR